MGRDGRGKKHKLKVRVSPSERLSETDRQIGYTIVLVFLQLLHGSWWFNLIKQKQQSSVETPGVIRTTSLDKAKYGWDIDLCICLNFRLN